MKKIKLILLLLSFFSAVIYSQDCSNYIQWKGCHKSIKRSYNIYMQPRNSEIGINDTLTYNIIFYGNRDYIISFCMEQQNYLINIRLLVPETREILYDNATDDYCESIGVGFYNTQNVIVEVILFSNKVKKENTISNDKICIGMVMQWKRIVSRKD